MKRRLAAVFERSLQRISLDLLLPRRLSRRGGILQIGEEAIRLGDYRRVVVVAFGKAAFQMTSILLRVLPASMPRSGVVSGVGAHPPELVEMAVYRGGHPCPNRQSVEAAEAAIEMLQGCSANDLVIFLLSGGGSAMCEAPLIPSVSIEQARALNQLLVTCGATVLDINDVRKHLSRIKGGRLAEFAHPARQITLYVSDAPPGHPSNVASGPTMPDESTLADCRAIVARHDLAGRLPAGLGRILESDAVQETPKAGAACFENSSWHCLADPEDALQALLTEIRWEGWLAAIDRSIDDDCPLEQATTRLLSRLERMRRANPGSTVAVLASGEFCCPVIGDGVGGRNQAFVLDCVPRIQGRRIAVLSAGTDGIDGNSRAAGAVADGSSFARAAALGLSPKTCARQSDSNSFFDRLEDALWTGPTGNNLRDLRILTAW